MPRPVSLSFDLLETFVKLIDEYDGDAARTAEQLEINQPSMSKRLRYLQLKSPVLPHPWLVREGKRWILTKEGEKALPAVRDLLHRYEQLTRFTHDEDRRQPDVTYACGRQSAAGFVKLALRDFRRQFPDSRVRISTLRGAARIEGVSNGSLDLATVTHSKDSIERIARRELHIETIAEDRLALVCKAGTPWAGKLEKLPQNKVVLAGLKELPLILPEPDAGIRKGFDDALRAHDPPLKLDIRLEIGGWSSILAYLADGFGVGLVSAAAIGSASKLIVRYFDPHLLPPIETRLICRQSFGSTSELDLSPHAFAFYEALKRAAGKA